MSDARVTELETYIQLQNANAPQAQQQAKQAETSQQSITLQVMKELNFDPESVLTGTEQAQVNDVVLQRIQTANQSQFQVQSFIASKPDFTKVVGVQDPITGQYMYAQPLLRVINANPSIAQALRGAGTNAAVLAYELASKDPQYIKEVAEAAKDPVIQASEKANQAIEQANSQVSISAVAGAGAIDRAAALRAMSEPEFEQYKQGIMSRA